MKSILFFLLVSSFITSSWTVVAPDFSSEKLTSIALTQYLIEMQRNFDWAPTTLLVRSEDRTQKQQLQKPLGKTQILVKNEAELLAYSLQHAGKTLLFLTIEITQLEDQQYMVYVVNEGIKTVLKDGIPTQEYVEAPLGRACMLQYNKQLQYQNIDCLLLPEDPEERE